MIPLAAFALTGCLALSPGAEYIRAGDLAAPLPQWNEIAADTQLVPGPIPGVQRIFRVAELRRLAAKWGVAEGEERDLCFAIPVAPPDPARMLAAMQRALPAARIEILETSRQAAPEGEFQFPRNSLLPNAAASYWHGYVGYGHARRFPVWARVKVVVSQERVVAVRDLKQGVPLEAAQLKLETLDSLPQTSPFVSAIADAVGRVPRRSIAAGTPIRPEWLENAKDVQRGETVQVEVVVGAAHLRLEGVAAAAGAVGETIDVENPISRRRFRARIAARGKVVVAGSL